MSPQTLAKLLTIGLIGLIIAVAGDDSNYSYWKPENSANYDEYETYQSASVPHPFAKFVNGIQNRQSFGASLAPVVAGAIAVAGVGGIIYNDNLNNVNRLNDEDAKLSARIKTLETSTAVSALATRVSAVESSSSGSSTLASSNCAKLMALDAITFTQTGVTAAEAAADLKTFADAIIAAVAGVTC